MWKGTQYNPITAMPRKPHYKFTQNSLNNFLFQPLIYRIKKH